ncbi:MAG: hypothetical protein R2762_23060 [Bryobacteraceae bacterium]
MAKPSAQGVDRRLFLRPGGPMPCFHLVVPSSQCLQFGVLVPDRGCEPLLPLGQFGVSLLHLITQRSDLGHPQLQRFQFGHARPQWRD